MDRVGCAQGDGVDSELADCLEQAHASLAGLVNLLGACPPTHAIGAAELHALLLPVADQVSQAEQASRLLSRRPQRDG